MNDHKTACLVLACLVAAMLFGVNKLRNSTNTARETAEAMRSQAETAEQQAQLAQIQLKTLDSKTSELRSIYNEWKPHFDSYRSPQDAERRVADVIREGDVFLISQKFESRELDRNAMISDALVGDLVIEDDYAKTLNWLGKLEEAIPSCRITRCNLQRGDRGNDVHLELQIQIPVLEG
ncbi:MAG: hypothetical protein WD342_05880 [Verrucomicrobiales bacterium]